MNEKCDICGSEKYYAGVASSALGPFSYAYCQVCLRMNADTWGMVKATIDSCGGIDKVGAGLIYFDKNNS